jgi:hypothetical protein
MAASAGSEAAASPAIRTMGATCSVIDRLNAASSSARRRASGSAATAWGFDPLGDGPGVVVAGDPGFDQLPQQLALVTEPRVDRLDVDARRLTDVYESASRAHRLDAQLQALVQQRRAYGTRKPTSTRLPHCVLIGDLAIWPARGCSPPCTGCLGAATGCGGLLGCDARLPKVQESVNNHLSGPCLDGLIGLFDRAVRLEAVKACAFPGRVRPSGWMIPITCCAGVGTPGGK